jgi:superfamily II RNA helicase
MMKTEQTFKQAMAKLGIAQKRIADEDIRLLESTGYAKHYAFPFAQWNEADAISENVRRGIAVHHYERV